MAAAATAATVLTDAQIAAIKADLVELYKKTPCMPSETRSGERQLAATSALGAQQRRPVTAATPPQRAPGPPLDRPTSRSDPTRPSIRSHGAPRVARCR